MLVVLASSQIIRCQPLLNITTVIKPLMAVSMVTEAMAGVHDKLVGTTIGFKSISEILLKRVVLLPKGTEMGVNGLWPSSYLIPLMEQTGIRMELIWLDLISPK